MHDCHVHDYSALCWLEVALLIGYNLNTRALCWKSLDRFCWLEPAEYLEQEVLYEHPRVVMVIPKLCSSHS